MENDKPADAGLEEIREQLRGKRIYIVPYTHCDWAWRHTRLWHRARYVSVFEDVLVEIEKGYGFKWYMDCFVTALAAVIESKPELLDRIVGQVEAGNIGVCGTYSNIRPNMAGDEAYIRNMILGRKYFQACFPSAKIEVHADSVDVVLGHPQIPQLLKKAGYRYFRAGRPNDFLRYKGVSRDFIWEGLDGSRILSWRGDYSGFYDPSIAALTPGADWGQTVKTVYDNEIRKIYDSTESQDILIPLGMDDTAL